MSEIPYREWDGEYEKVWYELKTDEGVYLCWPNAGVMHVCATLSGKKYSSKSLHAGEDVFVLRETDKHPLNYI